MDHGKRILVVDDNEEFCDNLADILEMEGYEVFTAYDGFSAIEMIMDHSIDLVIMDVKMPVIDGVETFRRIQKITPGMPVIMMTAFAMEDLIQDALQEGAFGYMKKPLDYERFFNHIESALPGGGLILVADDEDDIRENLKDILSDKNYRVATARQGETAIEKAKAMDFDVIILDLKLPTLNGLDTYLAIREFRPNVTVIAITGHIGELQSMATDIVDKNAFVCIEKPLDIDPFIKLLDDIFHMKNSGILKKPAIGSTHGNIFEQGNE